MRNNKKKQAALWGNMTTEQRREARALARDLQAQYNLDGVFNEIEAQDATWANAPHEYLNGQYYRVTCKSEKGHRQVTFKRRGAEYYADYRDGGLKNWVAVA
jgi:hypothetical protein